MAAKLGFEIVKQAMLKLLMKKGDDGIVLTLPKNEILDLNTRITMDRLIRNNIDPNSLTSPDQVINVLDNIDNQTINKAVSADSEQGKKITEMLFGKKGEVIEFPQKRTFAEEIDAMKKSGDIVDVEDVKISEKITDRDMFKDANQRLKGPIKGKMDMGEFGKVDVETDYSASINRKEFFDPKAKNMYGETVKTGAEFIGKEKERILNTINRKKKEMVPPTHSNYKLLKKSLDDQEDALEAIKVTEDLGGNENMFDFLRTKNIADYKAKPLQRSNYTKTDAEIKAEIEAGNKKGIESLKNKLDDPEDMARGGRAGFYTGGITDVEPSLDDIGHGADALNARTRLMSPGNQATTSTGLNYLLAEDNDNMRIPFAKGKIAKEVLDKGRRGFMKAAGVTGAGIAALKTGLLGFGEKAAPVVEKVAEAAPQVPAYFLNLVQKIKNLGTDVTEVLAYKDRQKVTKYKDYELTEDLVTGRQEIQRMKVMDDGSEAYYGQPLTEETYMSYTPGKGQIDETTKGKTPPDEYEEGTAYIRSDKEYAGEVVDESFKISDEVIEEGTKFEDNLSDFGKTKKADGGRIGYGKGKLVVEGGRKFLEKVFGKERFATMIENDPRMEQGMLEVVDMFRKKDKEGLKMYLQKYMPHMDDAEIEDFIVGSDGTEGITGQLIRLGSGREYESLIDMKKQADEIRKLENFDVDGVSKNAEGGRIGLFMGGGLKAGKGLLRTLLNFMAEKSTHGKKGSEMLQLVNPKQLDKYLNDPALMGKVSPEAPAGIPEIINAKKKEMTEDRSNMVGDLIGTARRIKKVDDDIVNYKKTIINDMIGRGIDRETAAEMAENLAEMVAKNAGKKASPNITDQGLLELENIQKNLVTKDRRKLQAQGGLTTMLGE